MTSRYEAKYTVKMTGEPREDGACVLVTGASGFVGRSVCEKLQESNYRVVGLSGSSRNEFQQSDSGNIAMDWNSPADFLKKIFRQHPISTVVHTATKYQKNHTENDIMSLLQANVELGSLALEMASQNNARFINLASSWQFSQVLQPSYRSFYVASKIAFEAIFDRYLACNEITGTSLVIYDTYGPKDDRPKIVPSMIKASLAGEALEISNPRNRINLLHSRDVAEGVIAQIKSNVWPRFTQLKADEDVSLMGLANMVEGNLGLPPRSEATAELLATSQIGYLDFPSPVGWRPKVNLKDGINETIEAHINARH